jgi:glutaminase
MIKRIVYNNFIYSDFDEQYRKAQAIFEEVKAMEDKGTIPDYIPALEDVDPEQFAVSICTVDGQIINLGDFDSRASMHAISGVVSYLIAHEQLHEENLKKYIGTEPSGNQFNDLSLMDSGIPHNPLNSAGILMSTSLIFQGDSNAKKFENYTNVVKKMIGGRKVKFNNEMYLSEVESAHANYSILYMMEGHGTLPENHNVKEILEFYTRCCALNLSITEYALIAATLANGGICPTTEERCFEYSSAVKLTLSEMLSAGMNTKSGRW